MGACSTGGAPQGAGLPAQSPSPAACPPSRRLALDVLRPGPALPDVQPGALPQLEELYVVAWDLHAPLPPSWGASPAALPSLRSLEVHMPFAGGLPPQWAAGFSNLRELVVGTPKAGRMLRPRWMSTDGQPQWAQQRRQQPSVHVPPEWAAGFPRLSRLALSVGWLDGSISSNLPNGSFPALTEL